MVATNSLIPVLVTGIQRAEVLWRRELSQRYGFIHGADTPWLDSCDEHRNEGRDTAPFDTLAAGWSA
jgi:hypothetical protein